MADLRQFGRRIVAEKYLKNPNWLALLSTAEPPNDGLYIPRNMIPPKVHSPKLAPGQISTANLTNMEILKAVFLKKVPESAKRVPIPEKTEVASKPSQDNSIAALDFDWESLSPDDEASILGLEQLEEGQTLAIVGAGLTGLTLAWAASRARPDIKIQIYESKPRVGGWVESEKMPKAVFESGPRTLLPAHPGTPIILDMLDEIKQLDILCGIDKRAPTNRKGLVFQGKLNQMPSSFMEGMSFLFGSPLLKGVKWSMVKELFRKTRPQSVEDESVSSFLSRRFNNLLDERLVSAIFRGIYGASTKELSARSVVRFSQLYYLERTKEASVLASAFTGAIGYLGASTKEIYPKLFNALTSTAPSKVDKQKYSLYAFKDGMSTFPEALKLALKQNPNVEIFLNEPVQRLEPSYEDVVVHSGNKARRADVAVVTTCSSQMFQDDCPELANNVASIDHTSLAVVNVSTPEPLAKDWFGVLVPRAEDSLNPEKVLGIIFDSSIRAAAEPLIQSAKSRDNKASVKAGTANSSVTVMLGGDLWDDMTEVQAKTRAFAALHRLLGEFDESKAHVKVRLQRQCIPTPHPGHSALVHLAHSQARLCYGNRVALCGMALGRGIGVSECILDATLVASRFSDVRKAVHPRFFFGEWLSKTRPELFA